MHTEDEAKAKWCPFARTLEKADLRVRADRTGVTDWLEMNAAVAASVNREPSDYDKDGNETVVIAGRHRCIGSDCMAWRWGRTHIKNPEAPDGDLIPSTRTYGFCGLAGAPFAGHPDHPQAAS